jgi:multidrug efflux pump subunit AcrA (membrane-fusion protein)
LTAFPSSPIAPYLSSSIESLPFPESTLLPTQEFDIDTLVPTQEFNTTAQLVTLDSIKQIMAQQQAHFESRFTSLQEELREQQRKTAEQERRADEQERKADEQERRADEQERRADEQAQKVEELVGSSRSHERDLRNLKQAIIYQCYAWQAGPFITPADLSTIGYNEVNSHSIHSLHLGDLCLFLSDHPEKKSNQVNTIWLIMERMLQNHETESLVLKHNQQKISVTGSDARNHLLSTSLPDRKELLALRLRLVRRQILADFSAFRSSQQHRVSLTGTPSETETLTRFEDLVQNLPFAIPETIPRSGIAKSFYTMLLLEKFSAE